MFVLTSSVKVYLNTINVFTAVHHLVDQDAEVARYPRCNGVQFVPSITRLTSFCRYFEIDVCFYD